MVHVAVARNSVVIAVAGTTDAADYFAHPRSEFPALQAQQHNLKTVLGALGNAMLATVPVVVCCVLALVSALAVVLLKRPVHVAVGLLAHSLSMAALYFALDAQLMAVAQVLIYSGAIVVLFLIVVALLPTGGKEELGAGRFFAAALVLCAVGAGLVVMMNGASSLAAIDGAGPSVKDVGKPLFTSLLAPFEMTAPLLLAAIVSAIALWKRQERTAQLAHNAYAAAHPVSVQGGGA